MEQQLRKLGLSWNAVQVYVSLLKCGETTVGNIIKSVRAHRQSVYNALEELVERGMVVRIIKNKISHFKVANPQVIVQQAEQQVSLAQQISQAIQVEFQKSQYEHEITIYDGRDRIKSFFMSRNRSMITGDTLYVISNYANQYKEVIEEDFLLKDFNRQMKKRKLKVMIIAGESKRQEFASLARKLNDPKDMREIRYIPDAIMLPNAVEIWKQGISFSSFEDDWFVIEILNPQFQETYFKYFQRLWQIAKE